MEAVEEPAVRALYALSRSVGGEAMPELSAGRFQLEPGAEARFEAENLLGLDSAVGNPDDLSSGGVVGSL